MKHILPLMLLGTLSLARAQTPPNDSNAPTRPVVPANASNNLLQGHESDKRMPANTKGGWGLEKAVIKDPSLPRVLLIGDSILGGYHSHVIKGLLGKANVDVWLTPLNQNNPKVLDAYKEAIAQGPYAVIHFNIGLHGIQPGRIPTDKYIPLTRALVSTIRESAPQAKLIWASTTPALHISEIDEPDPSLNPVVISHNAMAAQIMAENNIPIDDLYTLMMPHLNLRKGGNDNYHWKPAAYQLMAGSIVESIEKALAASHP